MNIYRYVNNNGGNFLDPFGKSWGSIATNFVAGVAVGVVVAAAVTIAAPLAVTAIIAAGVSAVIASATVTTGLGVAAAAGAFFGGRDIYNNAKAGDWDAVAFGVGTMVGAAAVGVSGGGRYVGEEMSGQSSSVKPSWNPFADTSLGYDPKYPGGSIPGWLGSAPTPQSGGASSMGMAMWLSGSGSDFVKPHCH